MHSLEQPRGRRHSVDVQPPRSHFVDAVRIVAPTPGIPHDIERLPDGKSMLVLRMLDDGTGDVSLLGPRTRALFKTATGVTRAVMIELQPGAAAALFGVPMNELVDRHVLLEDLWGRFGAELRDELLAMHSTAAIIDRLAQVFAAHVDHTRISSTRLARRAVQVLERNDVHRVEEVAANLDVTARHLRRVFVESIGIGPKEFARCLRLQRAVRHAATADWGRVAADAGYYDQAHLIADFHDLVGVTPSAYGRRTFARKRCDHVASSSARAGGARGA